MILHVAVFRWREGVEAEEVERLVALMRALPARIAALRGYRVGADLGLQPGNGDFAVVAEVEDEAGLAAYLEHPLHLEVREALGGMAAERTAVQIAVG